MTGANFSRPHLSSSMNDLDELAADLRDRLLADTAGAEPTSASGSARSWTARRRCSTPTPAPSWPSGSPSARSASARWSRCCATPPSTRSWSAGRRRCGSSAAGGWSAPACASPDERDLRDAIERILAPLGRRVDEAEPLCDARLPDGSRVNVVIPPLALDGPVLTIRRFRRRGFTPDELVANGTLTRPLLDFLARAVRARASLLVCGGTGSGKTTTLNALSAFIGADERVVTIEDAAELRLRQPHVVRLEARPPNLEGRGEVTIRRLVRNALRMRPDRIVVGEVRGPEALDMLTALSTGHDGSLCTIHAGSPAEALRRVETLALMADLGLPHAALREQVADAFDLVICQARAADGTRRVVEVAEVLPRRRRPGRARDLCLARGQRSLARRADRRPHRPPRDRGADAA